MDEEKYNYYSLSNHIRIIHKEVSSPISHIGLVLNTGSRDELPDENGIAHFIEHTIFKSTHKRSTYQVLSYLENVGGELNAYTTKEETFFYASILNNYFDRVLDLLSDIVFDGAFNEKDLETEKDVVIEEINSYRDNPSELIYDEFENQIFEGHPLGTFILGTKNKLRSFNRKKILNFIERTYHTDNMVISIVGEIPFRKCITHLRKYFEPVPTHLRDYQRKTFDNFHVDHRVKNVHGSQAHFMMGRALPKYDDKKHQTATLLNNILGGPGLNSRLNLAIRERNGYVYTIESSYAALSDIALFSIYAGTDDKKVDRCKELIYKEIHKLCNKKLGTLQLHRAKLQLMGQTCITNESNLNEMLSIGKNHLIFDKVESIPELLSKIENVTASELLEMANEMLDIDSMSSLLYQKK